MKSFVERGLQAFPRRMKLNYLNVFVYWPSNSVFGDIITGFDDYNIICKVQPPTYLNHDQSLKSIIEKTISGKRFFIKTIFSFRRFDTLLFYARAKQRGELFREDETFWIGEYV